VPGRTTISQALEWTPDIKPKVLVEDQSVNDIMEAMIKKHKECQAYYDSIVNHFYGGDIYDVCERLWTFCKHNFRYKIESVELQRVSSPATMLRRGHIDCKNYSLFIGGVLDAMKRQGEKLSWCFRYVSQNLLNSEKHHVFVVVNPKSDNIWIDPVLNGFNKKPLYWYKTSRQPGSAAVGYLNRGRAIYGTTAQALTPAQSGAYYGAAAYNNQNLIPGAGTAFLANPPITYWVTGGQLILPPTNEIGGAAVPALPTDLQVKYASSFMGYPIPSNLPYPVVKAGNVLQWSAPVNGVGSITSAQLEANNKLLWVFMMAAMGPLINSYSSYPYANGFGMLSSDIMTKSSPTSKYNMLNPDDKETFVGQVLTEVGTQVLPVVATVAGLVTSVVASPAAGAAVTAALEGVDSVLNQAENTSGYGATKTLDVTNPASVPSVVPGTAPSLLSVSNLTTLSMSNPLIWLAAAAGVFFLLNSDE
jgi:hypothetical protein